MTASLCAVVALCLLVAWGASRSRSARPLPRCAYCAQPVRDRSGLFHGPCRRELQIRATDPAPPSTDPHRGPVTAPPPSGYDSHVRATGGAP